MLGLANLLAVGAGIAMLLGAVMVIVAAFKESVAWGLLCLFVPFAALVFVITQWRKAKDGFLIWLAGAGVVVVARVLLLQAM